MITRSTAELNTYAQAKSASNGIRRQSSNGTYTKGLTRTDDDDSEQGAYCHIRDFATSVFATISSIRMDALRHDSEDEDMGAYFERLGKATGRFVKVISTLRNISS